MVMQGQFVDGGSVSALSENVSKSACNFPKMSSAAFVFFSSLSRRVFWCCNISFSPLLVVRFARRLPFRAASEPASRARRHSVMCEE